MNYLKCYDKSGADLKYIFQWDTNRDAIIKDIEFTEDIEVHICHVDSNEALVVTPSMTDGNIIVSIPNILLQRAAPVILYIVNKPTSDSFCTTRTARITVVPKAKPHDYVYTETEVLTWRKLDDRLKRIENGEFGQKHQEAIERAVDEYLMANPPLAGEPGKDGADGKTPVKGEDYFTKEDVQEIAEQASKLVEVPDTYTRKEIDTIMGAYITDIDALLGGDA